MCPDLRTSPFELAVVGRAPDAARDGENDRARAAGYAAGFAAGAREAARVAMGEAERLRLAQRDDAERRDDALAAAVGVLARAAAAAAARTAPVLAQSTTMLHGAALELATAVLGCELDDGERSARAALARVLEHPDLPGVQTVRLHPRDLEALRAAGGMPDVDGVQLVADASLAPGDAIAEHPDGYLDARIATALDRARTALGTPDGSASTAGAADAHGDPRTRELPHQRGQRA